PEQSRHSPAVAAPAVSNPANTPGHSSAPLLPSPEPGLQPDSPVRSCSRTVPSPTPPRSSPLSLPDPYRESATPSPSSRYSLDSSEGPQLPPRVDSESQTRCRPKSRSTPPSPRALPRSAGAAVFAATPPPAPAPVSASPRMPAESAPRARNISRRSRPPRPPPLGPRLDSSKDSSSPLDLACLCPNWERPHNGTRRAFTETTEPSQLGK